MPWFRYRLDEGGPLAGGMFHLKLDRRHYVGACATCGYIGERQCDWKKPLHRKYESPTCDRWLCHHCTTEVGPDKDLCPEHVGAYKAWLAGRTNSTDGGGP